MLAVFEPCVLHLFFACLAPVSPLPSFTHSGMVMVWDTTSLAPLISHPVVDVAADGTPQPRRLTSVLFANDAPVLVTGDAAGNVDVYRLLGLPLGPPTIDEQIEALAQSLHPT